jgi:hypothetical protein
MAHIKPELNPQQLQLFSGAEPLSEEPIIARPPSPQGVSALFGRAFAPVWHAIFCFSHPIGNTPE